MTKLRRTIARAIAIVGIGTLALGAGVASVPTASTQASCLYAWHMSGVVRNYEYLIKVYSSGPTADPTMAAIYQQALADTQQRIALYCGS